MKIIKSSFITLFTLVALIMLWGYTASSKFLEMEKFIFQMQLVPFALFQKYASLLAWLIPLLELSLIALLMIKHLRFYGILFSAILLTIFSIYISLLLVSGLKLPCTCGGIISTMGWKTHLLFNISYILLCLYTLKHYFKNSS